jgi:hypothetical protein
VYGKCHIQLSTEDRDAIESQQIVDHDDVGDVEEESVPAPQVKPTIDTSAADSDEEVDEPEPEPVKKKVVKKAPAPEPVVESPAAEEPAKKKVVKKKVVAPV